MRRAASLVLFTAILAPSVALGQIRTLDEDQKLRSRQPPNISTELMDPAGGTRLHLTTRGSFSDGEELFTDLSFWTFDLQAFLRVQDNWSVGANLPFALYSPPGGTNQFVLGNIRVGTVAGFDVRLQPQNRDVRSARFRLGAGVDMYLPTTSTPEDESAFLGAIAVAGGRFLHNFEPELFIEDAMFFRIRAHAELSFDVVIVEGELGFSPGFTTTSDSEALLLVSWAARVSAKPTYLLDPYLEVASSFHVVGKDAAAGRDYETNVWITPGVRFHFGQVDPAFFVSVNVEETALLFGIDLAGAAREYIRVRQDDDFLDSFD